MNEMHERKLEIHMGELEMRYAHQGICVENMDESIEWYKRIFNAQVVSDELSEDFGAPLNCRIVHMLVEMAHFELFEYLGEDGKKVPKESRNSVTDLKTCGNKHVCYEINIPRFIKEKIVPNQVWIDHGPEKQGDNWQLFIRDLNGVLYEFHDIGGALREPDAFNEFPCKLFE